MQNPSLYNLSGCVIPDGAEITTSGDPTPGSVLIVESIEGSRGTARWRSVSELRVRMAERAKAGDARPAWAPPLKAGAPYS